MPDDPHQQDPASDRSLRLLKTVNQGHEAEMICGRLEAEGIVPVAHGRAMSMYTTGLWPRDIYVQEADLDRAREVLEADANISEEELIQAQEEAAAELPTPEQALQEELLRRASEPLDPGDPYR
jgi:hypothetical protein